MEEGFRPAILSVKSLKITILGIPIGSSGFRRDPRDPDRDPEGPDEILRIPARSSPV